MFLTVHKVHKSVVVFWKQWSGIGLPQINAFGELDRFQPGFWLGSGYSRSNLGIPKDMFVCEWPW